MRHNRFPCLSALLLVVLVVVKHILPSQAFLLAPTTPGARAIFSPSPSLSRGGAASKRSIIKAAASGGDQKAVDNVSVVLLAGGVGKRMKADRPKQFLDLLGKPVFLRSLDVFTALPGVTRIVIVLDESYRQDYKHLTEEDPRIVFADPGKERQDSVFNGFSKALPDASLICIHDAARPLVTQANVLQVLRDGYEHGAAVLGVPMKATVKESEDGQFVLRTIPRSRLWEIQTPQVLKPSILKEGFDKVRKDGVEVTDDVSIAEYIEKPVKLTMGEYTNIKLTTPDDMSVAEEILRQRKKGNLTPAAFKKPIYLDQQTTDENGTNIFNVLTI